MSFFVSKDIEGIVDEASFVRRDNHKPVLVVDSESTKKEYDVYEINFNGDKVSHLTIHLDVAGLEQFVFQDIKFLNLFFVRKYLNLNHNYKIVDAKYSNALGKYIVKINLEK